MKFKKTIVPVIIYTVELRLLCCEIVYLGNKTRVDLSSYNFNFHLLLLALEKENNFLELKKITIFVFHVQDVQVEHKEEMIARNLVSDVLN